ncbi:hypothetical protein Ancab_002356, partial [Ancistrocladus abbreviatus]
MGVKNQVNGSAIEEGTKASMGAAMKLESVSSGVDKTHGKQRQLGSSPIPSVDRTKSITCYAEERWKAMDFKNTLGIKNGHMCSITNEATSRKGNNIKIKGHIDK